MVSLFYLFYHFFGRIMRLWNATPLSAVPELRLLVSE